MEKLRPLNFRRFYSEREEKWDQFKPYLPLSLSFWALITFLILNFSLSPKGPGQTLCDEPRPTIVSYENSFKGKKYLNLIQQTQDSLIGCYDNTFTQFVLW